MDPLASLPGLFSCLESATRLGWGAAQADLMRRISQILGLPVDNQSGNGVPSEQQIRTVVISAIDARFTARDAGLDTNGQIAAALEAATSTLVQLGLAPTGAVPDARTLQIVQLILETYDTWMASHGASDGLEGERAVEAAVRAMVSALGIPLPPPPVVCPPQNLSPFGVSVVSAALRSSGAYDHVGTDDAFLMHVLEQVQAHGAPPLRQLDATEAQAVLDAAILGYGGPEFAKLPGDVAAAFGAALVPAPLT